MDQIGKEIISYASDIGIYELLGLIFGLLAVWYLIREKYTYLARRNSLCHGFVYCFLEGPALW